MASIRFCLKQIHSSLINSTVFLLLALLGILMLAAPSAAKADVTYTYAGNSFNTFSGGSRVPSIAASGSHLL
jgi:hypothetical protein